MVRAMDIPSLLYIFKCNPQTDGPTFVKLQRGETSHIETLRNTSRNGAVKRPAGKSRESQHLDKSLLAWTPEPNSRKRLHCHHH